MRVAACLNVLRSIQLHHGLTCSLWLSPRRHRNHTATIAPSAGTSTGRQRGPRIAWLGGLTALAPPAGKAINSAGPGPTQRNCLAPGGTGKGPALRCWNRPPGPVWCRQPKGLLGTSSPKPCLPAVRAGFANLVGLLGHMGERGA